MPHFRCICLLAFECVQAALEPLGVFFCIRGIADRFGHQFLIGADDDVEGLGGVFKVLGLEGGKFIADGKDVLFTAIVGRKGELLIVGQSLAVVDIKRNEDKIIFDQFFHAGLWPNVLFHFAAVYASPAGEVDQDRLVLLFGQLQGFIIVVDHVGFYFARSVMGAIEAIGKWRRKSADQGKIGIGRIGDAGKEIKDKKQEEGGHGYSGRAQFF